MGLVSEPSETQAPEELPGPGPGPNRLICSGTATLLMEVQHSLDLENHHCTYAQAPQSSDVLQSCVNAHGSHSIMHEHRACMYVR